MNKAQEVLCVLSDETRLAIVSILSNHDICSGAVARRLGISDAAVSQHMRVLREAGLVTAERRGYFTHFRVDAEALTSAAEYLMGMAGSTRLPCDPDFEGCTEPRRGRCTSEKCSAGCPRIGTGERCSGCTMFERKEGSERMKVAVTYENGEIFQHFGRTEQFKVYDIQDGRVVSSEVVGTDGRGHGELVGVLRQLGVSALICGGLGGGARQGLEASGIRVCSGNSGSADAAAQSFADGTMEMHSEATCHHHGEGDHQCQCGRH